MIGRLIKNQFGDILTFCIKFIRLVLNYDRTVTRQSADSSEGTTTISKFQVWWMESYDGQRSILKFKAQKREIQLSSRRPPESQRIAQGVIALTF